MHLSVVFVCRRVYYIESGGCRVGASCLVVLLALVWRPTTAIALNLHCYGNFALWSRWTVFLGKNCYSGASAVGP